MMMMTKMATTNNNNNNKNHNCDYDDEKIMTMTVMIQCFIVFQLMWFDGFLDGTWDVKIEIFS
jgi:hypothetical protein